MTTRTDTHRELKTLKAPDIPVYICSVDTVPTQYTRGERYITRQSIHDKWNTPAFTCKICKNCNYIALLISQYEILHLILFLWGKEKSRWYLSASVD